MKTMQKKKAKMNPSDRGFTCGKKKLPYVFSKEQLVAILGVVDDARMGMIIYMGVFQGLRIGEMVRLKWSEVDIENGEILILDAKNTKRYKSGYGKDRIVPINDMFMNVWKSYRAMNPDQEYVIPGDNRFNKRPDDNSLIRQFQKKLWEYLQKLGLLQIDYLQKNGTPRYKYHMHTLRHVCGTNLRRAGMKIEDIRDFLGHEDVDTTMVYAELAKDDLKEVSHIAYAYPKSRLGLPQPQAIEVSVDKDTLQLQKEILQMQLEVARQKVNPFVRA
ncbi:MAG: site-specific integrase [Nanoarchaeota archaeon]|nr:site-specific integrase [Nanoarchaeota archaeon]